MSHYNHYNDSAMIIRALMAMGQSYKTSLNLVNRPENLARMARTDRILRQYNDRRGIGGINRF